MSEIIYPNTNRVHGPWLLDSEQLQRLDSIINIQWEKLTKYRNKLIQQEIDGELNSFSKEEQERRKKGVEEKVKKNYRYGDDKFYKELRIDYRSKRLLIVDSFKEAAMHKEFENDLPIKFNYKIRCVDVESEIKLDFFNKIEYSVNTYSINESKELYYELEGWLKKVNPSILIKVWSRIGSWILPLLIGVLAILPSININNNRDILIEEAHKILNEGITTDEVEKALEIILSLETDYELKLGKMENIEIDYSKLYYLYALILCALILFFPPNSIIGIGKGEQKLNKWRNWINVVTYVIPVLIILPIIINRISNLL